jgi:hypothetical protein
MGLAVVFGNPKGVDFGAAVRTPWIKWGFFGLGHLLNFTEHLRGSSLIKPNATIAGLSNYLEKVKYTECINARRPFGLLERNLNL